jgi:hypothetical protein
LAVPDSSPRASAGVPVRFPRTLKPTDRTFSPPVANAIPRGRVSGPADLAPEALQESGCFCRGFFAEIYQRAGYMFQPASAMFQPASVTHTQLISFAFGASQEV